ncbi:MAG: ABC transporter ATP-binding protein [Bacteroidia bacterium]|nr:ABC transporter ATP-binding protein [Bacteroidia bacterium]
MLALVGKSGSGKTTLLKCIYGLEDLNAGEVWINNRKVLGPSFKLMPGDEAMSLVSQDYYVLDNHSVQENIMDKLIAYSEDWKLKRCEQVLSLLELKPLRSTRARFLSSGQKQRLAIARAIAEMPKVLLLDEPFSNLDKLLSDKLFAFITKEVKKHKTSVLLITHLAEEALKYSDRIAIMDKGKLLKVGEKWELYYRPLNTRLAGLLGDFNVLHPEDFEKKVKSKFKSKTFVRPDAFVILNSANQAHIQLKVLSCVYNGKCFELLCESKMGRTVMIYYHKAIQEDKKINCSVSGKF